MKLLSFLFPKLVSDPKVGEQWQWSGPTDPWTKPWTVTVIDVKDKWVKYDLFNSTTRISSFKRMYKKVS